MTFEFHFPDTLRDRLILAIGITLIADAVLRGPRKDRTPVENVGTTFLQSQGLA